MDTLTESELELYYILNNQNASNFKAKLFELICKADLDNTHKLSLVYPEFVKTVYRYQNEQGYWESVVNKLKGL